MRKIYTLTVYKAADGWRWRMTARNGRTVADSGEAYKTRAGAYRASASISGAIIQIGDEKGSKA